MTNIAFTGHRGLPHEIAESVDRALRAELERFESTRLVGITSLADGADTLFARAVLAVGGCLLSVLPAQDFRSTVSVEHRPVLDELMAQSADVVRLDFPESVDEAYMAASNYCLDKADCLIAVWDSQPSRGFGGTGDVVAEARRRDIPVIIVWPEGAVRPALGQDTSD